MSNDSIGKLRVRTVLGQRFQKLIASSFAVKLLNV